MLKSALLFRFQAPLGPPRSPSAQRLLGLLILLGGLLEGGLSSVELPELPEPFSFRGYSSSRVLSEIVREAHEAAVLCSPCALILDLLLEPQHTDTHF